MLTDRSPLGLIPLSQSWTYLVTTPYIIVTKWYGKLYSCNEHAYCTHLLTYLLTQWCRVLLEKLTGLQVVKKFPAFHGTRRFITALTMVRHLSLSWASSIQPVYPHRISWRSIVILSTHLRLGLSSGLLPSGFPTKTLYIHRCKITNHMELLNSPGVYRLNRMYSRHISSKAYKFHCRCL